MNNNLFQAKKKSLRKQLSVAILKTQLITDKFWINFHPVECRLQAICSKPNTSSTKNESIPLINNLQHLLITENILSLGGAFDRQIQC